MTDTQWGAPLQGEQMKMLRDAGLPDDVTVKPPYGEAKESSKFRYLTNGYRLPANHIAYKVIEAGWLDIPNVRLWFGGDKAPDDIDVNAPALCRDGDEGPDAMGLDWTHGNHSWDIIAYIAKADDCAGCGGLNISCPDGCFDEQPETTRAERFWQGKERHSLYRDESARALIAEALEFER